ncbi:RNA methyltransferase [Archaeoglobus neptunius]|uniref:RNA methyltransferase n=1 Tax=Archaeoglobus neptunius TaxID=2798580 RepID=UPI001925351E|nr:RNA methyltransferase [Archaeoglobus neptunius]
MKVYVVLVELKIPENIGFMARLVKNYGIGNLCLYKCNVTEASYHTASHAKDVLESAIQVDDLRSFLSRMNLVIGTTGVEGGDYKYLRKTILSPEDVQELVKGTDKVAVLFGREDYGLYNDELAFCHSVVRVPTSEEYPVMNVSHAAAVVLYFLRQTQTHPEEKLATARDVEIFLKNLENLLEMIQYPPHRVRRTMVVFRRILGRAKTREYEIQTLNAIFRKTVSYIKRMNK